MQMEDGQETRQRTVTFKLAVSKQATTLIAALPPIVLLAELADGIPRMHAFL